MVKIHHWTENQLGSGTSEEFIRARHDQHIKENTGDESRMFPQLEKRSAIEDNNPHDNVDNKTPSNLTNKTTSKTKRNDAVKKR